jgi:PiT family inorganic phosphate transporter
LIKIAVFIALAPLIGIIPGYLFMVTVYWICRRRTFHRVDRWFRRLQLISAAVFSLGHGTNDVQKTMGIITVLVYRTGYLECEFQVPFSVILICHAAIALGSMAGGWRVIETLGMKITKLKPVHGFCVETAAASSILLSTVGGIPVSTTHTITGAIIGVGAITKLPGTSELRI